ncbi:hypothetical protein HJFPF1_01670 [Paramyrothecium foliicola]|nr:hypothetical protein HJFPF1_01670 [Paramyrothecium foliicola]
MGRQVLQETQVLLETKKKGFTVLQDDDMLPEYVFGMNDVKEKGLQETKNFIQDILSVARGATGNQPLVRLGLLTKIVRFNKARVRLYILGLRKSLAACMRVCSRKWHEDDEAIQEGLQQIDEACDSKPFSASDDDACTEAYLSYLRPLKAFVSPTTGTYHLVAGRVEETKTSDGESSECWSDLQHWVSRLMALDQAARVFVDAHKEWPELFNDFKITGIPSSGHAKQIIGNKSLVASNIVGRMTADITDQTLFRRLTSQLQMMELDGRLKEIRGKGIEPIVHSEILVDDWIGRRYPDSEPPFFKNWRYIGASKPTCRLCKYFFEAQARQSATGRARVTVRPSHDNLYVNWRFPDVYQSQGPAAVQRRMRTISLMIQAIRQDTFSIILERMPMGKKHDTNTYSVFSAAGDESDIGAHNGDGTDVEDLEQLLGRRLTL